MQDFLKSKVEAWKAHAEEWDCEHAQVVVRIRTIKGGSTQYVNQCLKCGSSVGNPLRKSDFAHELLQPFDIELQDYWDQKRKDAVELLKEKPALGGLSGGNGRSAAHILPESAMNATSTDAVEPISAEEAAALQTHNAKKSSRDMVFGAILELADCETPAKAPDIARATGLAMPIVYDAIKTLKQRGRIYSDNGMFFIAEEHKDTEPVYHSALPNGVIKLEKGDQILELNQREARALAKTMGGLIEQANVIVMAHKQDEQQAQIRRLQRELSDVLERLSRVAPPPQMVLAMEGGK